jgi:ABC-type transporter Mla maintaining outer membrane lipid asymmetry permease subunit MlaE
MIERLGALLIDRLVALGNFVVFLLNALYLMVAPPYKPRLAVRQVRIIGAD